MLLLEAEPSRAFRSMARSVAGYLTEGQLGNRCKQVQLMERLGSVELEALVQRPDRPAAGEEEALREAHVAAPPACLVAFDPVAALVAIRWAETLPRPPLTIGVVGSLWLDPLWRGVRLDRWLLPDETLAAELLEEGQPEETLVPVGLGVCGRFGLGVAEGRASCRLTLGLPMEVPTLLLVTEGFFADEALRYVEAAARVRHGDQRLCLLVDAAGDRFALETASDLFHRLDLPGRVFGRVDEAGLLWGAADRVAGRALDHLITRALTYRCPFFALEPADPRQKGLVEALERLGAGEGLRGPDALATRLMGQKPWHSPLDGSRLDMVASPSVLPRMAETITRMVLEHEARP